MTFRLVRARDAATTIGARCSQAVVRGRGGGSNSKEHEQDAFPDILMTTSQIPDVNRELAEVAALRQPPSVV